MASTNWVVRRIDFGYFILPAQESGIGRSHVEALLGYAVVRPNGVLLFDTGLAEGDAEADAWYRPVRRPLSEALRTAALSLDDVRWIANCHLHFDHCGGNSGLPGRPVFVQSVELGAARTQGGYTLPHAIDFAGVNYQEIDGETEILPEILVIPTPGHTDGHQALAVRSSDGTVILAGQAVQTAFDFGCGYLARRAAQENHLGAISVASPPPWMDRLMQLDPRRVVFAHDYSVWEPAKNV